VVKLQRMKLLNLLLDPELHLLQLEVMVVHLRLINKIQIHGEIV
jgi:hypothetical protein